MAKKQTSKSKSTKSDASSKDVDIYEHKGSKRLNNPQVGLVNTKTEKAETKKTYKFDPHLDPQLQWAGKEEKNEFELPTVSLHVHERIDSRTIIEAVKKSPETLFKQLNLFNRPINKLNFVKEIQFYQHEKDWSNRLIAGDSLLVMNSLLEKEAMAGKIQTIYFDPPYGIKYGSNFQPFVNKKQVKDGSDEDLNQEPETIRAFRDTWELGVHSYLTHIRERLTLAKELLNESGSFFLQIGEENVHLVRSIMDEVFGSDNFCSMICFNKTGGLQSNFLYGVFDFVLWYAKDKNKIKYHPLFSEKEPGEEGGSKYTRVELIDGSTTSISEFIDEKGNLNLPKGARIFTDDNLTSQGNAEYAYELDGVAYKGTYKSNLEGMKKLELAGRILKAKNSLRYKRYFDDFPYVIETNNWNIGGIQSRKDPKIYVVQTATETIKRCILMTSDPGDLVFDPTCGSGSTAVVCEEYGRRWITCDTSRVAVSLAKQRLMTNVYNYFVLKSESEGISSGFELESAPRVKMSTITGCKQIQSGLSKQQIDILIKQEADKEYLHDRPLIDATKARVTGPFTVEAVPAPVVRELIDDAQGPLSISGPLDWISELLKTGIRLNNKKFLKLSRLEPMQGTKWLHAEGETEENPPQRIVVSFGSDFAPLEQRQVELALQEAEKVKPSPTVIVFAAFQFDPEAAKDIDEVDWGGVSVLKALMNADLFTDDLKKKRSSNESFWLVGQPDIEIEKIKSGEDKGKYSVNVNGFDYYNTKSGTIESGGANKIAMWMLDTDYDGRSLLPKQVFFPQAGDNEGWAKLTKSLRAEIDEELIEAYKGTESLPFETGENKKIAVKIIDDRGIESLVVRDLE